MDKMLLMKRRMASFHRLSPSDYTQDGLVCLFDGIKNTSSGHDSTSTTWKDLTNNGYDLSLDGTQALADGNITWTSNSCHVSVTDSILKNVFRSAGLFSPNKAAFTYECCYKINSLTVSGIGVMGILHGGGYSQAYFYTGANNVTDKRVIASGQQAGNNFSSNNSPSLTLGDIVTVGYFKPQGVQTQSNSKISYNGNIQTGLISYNQYSDASYASLTNTYIEIPVITGGSETLPSLPYTYTNGRTYDYDVYSFRLYDRVLTADEVLRNYNIDRQRFQF